MKSTADLENAMKTDIINSLSPSNNSELRWSIIKTPNTIYENHIYQRNDGLKIECRESSCYIIEPVEYSFENFIYQREILQELKLFKTYLFEFERQKVLEEKRKKLSIFFGLDIKTQRKEKLNKINENK